MALMSTPFFSLVLGMDTLQLESYTSSHNHTVSSQLPDASCFPSGLKHNDSTSPGGRHWVDPMSWAAGEEGTAHSGACLL